jgi:hypothetical protein
MMNASSVPLEEALPWSIEKARTVLIYDSVETDGRFLLYTLAKQVLTTPATTTTATTSGGGSWNSEAGPASGRVLWLECAPVSNQQVATGLKKIGCDAAATYLRGHNNNPRSSTLSSSSALSPLTIRSLGVEVGASVMSSTSLDGNIDGAKTAEETVKWNGEAFLIGLYKQVKQWLAEEQKHPDRRRLPSWIILDDVSSLAMMLGDSRPVYKFVDSLNGLSSLIGFGLAIRCSHDVDQEFYKQKQLDGQNRNNNDNAANVGWVGLGGLCNNDNNNQIHGYVPWERYLTELADGIVDVMPLTSGYSREVHGRLIFTVHPVGRGWNEPSVGAGGGTRRNNHDNGLLWTSLAINYAIADNGVRAIRLRGST